MRLPALINALWIDALPDNDLLEAESRLHAKFFKLEQAQKKLRGDKYMLFRGPVEVTDAWDRWARVNNAMYVRRLSPRRTAS
jgi:hypothetical protein